MPKIVDKEGRRRELAAALWRVVVEQGVPAVSVRSVAAEAGWSAGALRHYFATQDELVDFALLQVRDQVNARLAARLRRAPTQNSQEWAAQIIETLLPLDTERAAETLVWLAFTGGSWRTETIKALRRDAWHGSAHLARIAVAKVTGLPEPADPAEPLPSTQAEQTARRLQICVDGWALQLLSYPGQLPKAQVRRELRAEIATWHTDIAHLDSHPDGKANQ